MSETVIELMDVFCGYGERPVLNGVSQSVRAGEVVLLAGPNGCGKSTLLKAVAGVLRPTAGDILFEGESLLGMSVEKRIRRGIGYLRQTDNIFPSQTVEENLELAGLSMSAHDYRAARDRMLELFPFLTPKLPARAGSLSGGQRQALALAMVFLRPKRLYLLDEPAAGLSPRAAVDILAKVREFSAEDKTRSVLMVEHRLDLLSWISRAAFMAQGRITTESATSAQFLDPAWLAKHYFAKQKSGE